MYVCMYVHNCVYIDTVFFFSLSLSRSTSIYIYVHTLRLIGLPFNQFLEVGRSLNTLHMKPSRE